MSCRYLALSWLRGRGPAASVLVTSSGVGVVRTIAGNGARLCCRVRSFDSRHGGACRALSLAVRLGSVWQCDVALWRVHD
jgi:hypothetical protein